MKQRALVRLTAEQLGQELDIGGREFRLGYSFENDCAVLAVEHPNLRNVAEGAPCPYIPLEEAQGLRPSFGFGRALALLTRGLRVQRAGWNGKGMWIALQAPPEFAEPSKMTLPYIYMSTAQGDLVPWLASQTDILAEDWRLA